MLAGPDSQTAFIGIDPTAGRGLFTYLALDMNRAILALGTGKLSDVLAYMAGQNQAIVAINSPAGVNKGLAEWNETTQRLFPEPEGSGWSNLRLAEAELIQRGLVSTRTPSQSADCPHWMQSGFTLVDRLRRLGYVDFPAGDAQRQRLEVNSAAAFASLAGCDLFEQRILEGRLQRQLVLFMEGLPVNDPLNFFEEITRHHLLKGILPYEMVYSPYELNALAAAYIAWLAVNDPDRVLILGDKEEGCLVLPVRDEKKIENRD